MASLRKIFVVVLVASLGAVGGLGLAACSDDEDPDEQVEVVLREFKISPAPIEVTAGDIEFVVQNNGERVHEFAVRTVNGVERTGEIEPGEVVRMTVDLAPGRYRMFDPRENYRARGMRGTVIVSSADATVTERTVERTVIEEEPDIDDPELQDPEVQEPPPAAPPPPPPPVQPAPTVTQVIPEDPPPAGEPTSP